MPRLVKVNDHGRRIGEDHPRAVLTDHEVDLLMELLDEREALIERMAAEGFCRHDIGAALTAGCLSYRCLALKFEVCKRYIGKLAHGERRAQTAARTKRCG